MTTTHTEPLAYPFNEEAGLALNEAYTAARENAGMIRVQMPRGEAAWLATRYADARLVLGDRRFSRALAQESDEPRMSEYRRPGGILSMDPPDHTRLRTLVAKAFTARRVEELRPRVARLADDLIKELREHGQPADLVDLYALPIPVAVICELLGVPVADRPQFREWSDAALSTTRLTPEEAERSREELRAYMAGLIAEHRAQPQDDLMTALIEARDVRDRLTELELVDLCVGILVAYHETTASQIPNFVYALLDQHEHWERLCADPSLIPTAVEELLRFVPLGSRRGVRPVRDGGRRGRRCPGAPRRTGAGGDRCGQPRPPAVRRRGPARPRPRGQPPSRLRARGAPLPRRSARAAGTAGGAAGADPGVAGTAAGREYRVEDADAGPRTAVDAGGVVTMTWSIEVDGGVCIGSGMCAALLPETFELDGATARAVTEAVEPDETVLDAADSCPAMAITVRDGAEVVGPRP